MKHTVAVIGGGASGMTAALCAAKGGAAVCIYEKNDRVGKKLLATGNGKCNFTNLLLEENSYNGGGKEQIHKILESFSPRDCIAYFESMGMLTKEKNGYLYPASEQASTVLDLLRMQLGFYGVCVKADCEIVRLCEENGEYRLFGYRDGKKESFSAEKVIIAAGSIAGIKNNGRSDPYGLLRTLKLPLVPVAPALVQLCCGEAYLKAVAGSGMYFFMHRRKACLPGNGRSPAYRLRRFRNSGISVKPFCGVRSFGKTKGAGTYKQSSRLYG